MSHKESIFKALEALPNVWRTEARVEWTIEKMFPAASVNLLSSESGTGKTWLAYAIAGAVSRGVPFIGLPVKQMPSVYIDGENLQGVVKERLTNLGIPETPNLHPWGGWHKDPPFGPESPNAEEFAEATKGLIIWDSLIEFHTGDESSASETRRYMKAFRKLANLGATVIILHHAGKGQKSKLYRGSSDIKAAVDTAYAVEKMGGALGTARPGLHRLKMVNFKSRFTEGLDFSMEFVAGEGFRNIGEGAKADAKDKVAVLESLLTEEPMNGTEFKEKAKLQNISRQTTESFLKDWPHQKSGSKPNEKLYWRPKAA